MEQTDGIAGGRRRWWRRTNVGRGDGVVVEVGTIVARRFRSINDERNVVRQNGDDVNNVERAGEEATTVWRRPQSQRILEGEPTDAGRFDMNELLVVVRVPVAVLGRL